MVFIGIISDSKCFQFLNENICVKDISLIHINNKSIDNIKNIKFDIIIINKELKNLEEKKYLVDNLCTNSKYIVINTDINKNYKLGQKCDKKIITFGLNHKANVTISSITENNILVFLQKNINDKFNNVKEVGEKQIQICKENRAKIYEVLIIYIISIINNSPIILKSLEKSNFFGQN